MMQTVDDLVKSLDERFARWDLWRTATGSWVVRVEKEEINRESLQEALEEASRFVPLPKIPREPTLYNLFLFRTKIQKSG